MSEAMDKKAPTTHVRPSGVQFIKSYVLLFWFVLFHFSGQLKRSEEEKLALLSKVQELQSKFPFQILKGAQVAFGVPGSPAPQKASRRGWGPRLWHILCFCAFSDFLVMK